MTTKTKIDAIFAKLVSKQAAHLKRWGSVCPFPLEALTDLDWDGRKIGRNWKLIEAIRQDQRFIVSKQTGVRFNEIQINLS